MTSPSVTRPFLERHPEARYWLEQGLKPGVAKALVKAGYLTLDDLAGKFREDLTTIRWTRRSETEPPNVRKVIHPRP